MIKKHEYFDVLKHYTTDELVMVVAEAYRCMRSCSHLIEALDETEDEFELLDILEESILENITELMDYGCHSCSACDSINRVTSKYIKDEVFLDTDSGEEIERISTVTVFNKKLEDIVNLGAGVTDEERKEIGELSTELAGFFSYFLKFEFGVKDTYDDKSEKSVLDEADINSVFMAYCKRMNLDIAKTVDTIIAVGNVCRMRIPIFDEFPELEEAFDNIMGFYANDLNTDLLTIEMVRDVCDGTIEPVDLAANLRQMDAEVV